MQLDHLNPCDAARDWLTTQPDSTTAWTNCDRADWMLWYAQRALTVDKSVYVTIACEIARAVLHLVPEGDARPLKAIEAAEAWIKEPTERNRLNAAYYAAYYAANAAANAAYYAAYYAANAAYYAADANAAYAAEAAEAAAYYAADARKQQADIIRKYISITQE